ncbi:MAG: copper amine oxidase N-terminal domain-containing protein [candidate division WS1 bacterium]|nr:copper amine oxidase N-terminal domain-containing protein [candidate division WS1 bacterium]
MYNVRRLLVVVVMLAMVPAVASALTVVVNVQTLPSSPPAVSIGGRTMLPMRMVFEALGAEVGWENATQTAIGTRAGVVVRMTINSPIAFIGDRAVTLDVPPQLIGGSTYVPLRFPAEAYGADVKWNNATQTVTITLPDASPATPTTPETPATPTTPETPETPATPVTPPPAQDGTVSGVVSGSDASRVIVTIEEALQVYPVTPTTIILRQGKQVGAEGLLPGDKAEIEYDPQGNAKIVRATYETVEGKVVARVPNQLLLEGRDELFAVEAQTKIDIFGTGQEAAYGDINNGDTVVLRVTPGTTRVWAISIKRATTPPPATTTPTKPVIERFYSNAKGPLRGGQILEVTLEGTPGGKATFDIGSARKGMALVESEADPGRYETKWSVPPKFNVLGVPLVGHLTVKGVAADLAQSTETINIDTTPPVITVYGPTQGQEITARQPNLAVGLADSGVGVDFERSTVALKAGDTVLAVTTKREGRVVTLSFAPLPLGQITLLVDAYDKAGNKSHVAWSFRVIRGTGQQLTGTHDAAGKSLTPGSVLTVSATGPTNGQAKFSLGQWKVDLPMKESEDQPGTYTGKFTVPELEADRQESVSIKLQTAAGPVLETTLTPAVVFAKTRELTPVILRPTADEHVGQTVVVEGTTQPLAQVDFAITWQGAFLGLLSVTGQVTKAQLTADAQGHFQSEPISLNVESLVSAKDRTYTLTITATEGEETSEPVTVKFMQ